MAKQDIDCAVVMALREEFERTDSFHGFSDFFDLEPLKSPGVFQHFQFHDSTGAERTGVAAVMDDMSPLSAHEVSRDLLDLYNPTLVVNIGIAGSLSKDLKLGDVVIADEVDNYCYRAKVAPASNHIAPNPILVPLKRGKSDLSERHCGLSICISGSGTV